MLGAALLLATASTVSPYPVQDILSAFGEVCFDPSAARQDSAENGAVWKRLALEKGWTEISGAPERATDYRKDASARAYYWAKSLNYELYTALSDFNRGNIREEALFRRQIAGRDVYLSILGIDSENPTLAECRLRDPLGDGVIKSQITKTAIEKWLGHSVKTSHGWYRGTQYSWPNGQGEWSMRIHFGFDQRQLGVYRAYDPYSLYGMTLVRSDYSEIIVT